MNNCVICERRVLKNFNVKLDRKFYHNNSVNCDYIDDKRFNYSFGHLLKFIDENKPLCSKCFTSMGKDTLLSFIQLSYQAHYILQNKKIIQHPIDVNLYIYPKKVIKYILFLFFTQYKHIFITNENIEYDIIQYLFDRNDDFYINKNWNLYIGLTHLTNTPIKSNKSFYSFNEIQPDKSYYMHINYYPFDLYLIILGNIPFISNSFFNISHWDTYNINYFNNCNFTIKI